MSSDFQNTIWTDNDRTKILIWDAYAGFVEHFNNYMMLESKGLPLYEIEAGLTRYANYFYDEIYFFIDEFKFEIKDVKRIKSIFLNGNALSKQDLILIRRFFGNFMFLSGLKNIIMKKDNRDPMKKIKDKYKIVDDDDEQQ